MVNLKKATSDLEDRFDQDEILEIWGVFEENYDQKRNLLGELCCQRVHRDSKAM